MPIGCFNGLIEESSFREAMKERKGFFHESIVVYDDSGVVVIPKEQMTEAFYQKRIDIEL